MADIYEEFFRPGDTAFIHLAKEFVRLPPADGTDEPPTPRRLWDRVVNWRSRCPPFASDIPLSKELELTELLIGSTAMRSADLHEGLNLYPSLRESDGEDAPFVEVTAAIEPRAIDYRGMFLAIAHKDLPSQGITRLGWDLLLFVNTTRPVILDLRDDRNVGIRAPGAAALVDFYERSASLLNDYRRDDMTAAFGFWPKRDP